MGHLRSYTLAFVMGFGCCAFTARFLLPVPAAIVRREAADRSGRAGVVAECLQPQWLGVSDQHAENSPSAGQVADRLVGRGIDPGRQETLQPGSGLVDDPERGVTRPRQLRSRLDQLLQEGVEGELRAERDPRIDEDAETLECGLLRHVPPGVAAPSLDARKDALNANGPYL